MALDRRAFLRGGATALVVAAVSACTKKSPKTVGPGETTTIQPTTTSSGASPGDAAFLRTAASLEAVAVAIYQRAAASNLVKDAAALDATTLFLSHHMAHQQAINDLLDKATLAPITDPNGAVEKVFQPALAAATSQSDVLDLLFTLEEAIAQTYVYASISIVKPEHRAALMTIAGVQARHRVVLGDAFANQAVSDLIPGAFARSDNPLPPNAVLN